ncbi:MAG: triose-phosphate isomerase [Pseudohongiellaceae bacterium]
MRPRLVIGNWKMHGSLDFIRRLLDELTRSSGDIPESVAIAVCPTHLHLGHVQHLLAGSRIRLGAQDAHPAPEGAFTGAVAAAMLVEYGVHYVIVGHSERRHVFAESDALVAQKFAAVLNAGMTPVLCIGETLEQRQQDITEEVVLGQLDAVIDEVGSDALSGAIVAYEPVWAIGTGQTATPEQAQAVHRSIREHLHGQAAAIADHLPILYGGSVKADSAGALFSQADIDGGLVGGASLKADEFIAICKTAD